MKFAFILLGELQGHISNPSAQELMHFLFRPLHLIVQSCRGPQLAQTVLNPLHSEKCLKLLRENMTSVEAELFFSFGEKWTKSRESWPNSSEITDYNPTFRSGWIPPPLLPPPEEHPQLINNNIHVEQGLAINHKISQNYRMSHFWAPSITTLWILQPMKLLCFVSTKTSPCLCLITGQSQRLLGESIHSVVRERAPKNGPSCRSKIA
jgi:hypothetical protein